MPTPGELLVADVEIGDDYFSEAVILLLDVDETGALGAIINRPSETPLDQVLESWTPLATPPAVLFEGGPVSVDGAICIARVAHRNEEPPGWRSIVGDIGLLHLDTPTELAEGAYVDLRIVAGYCGWEPGQLEGELLRGDWYVVRARPDEVFGTDQTGLWRRVLRRLPGHLALLSTWASEPEMN